MLAFKGPDVDKEMAGAQKMIGILGGQIDTIWSYSLPDTEGQFSLIPIAKIAATPVDYPRSYSIISRKSAD